MKKTILSAWLAIAAGAVFAGGFTPSVAPASALWVCHLDVAGLKTSAVGKALWADPRVAGSPHLADIKARFGLDPLQDVRGMTLYTASTGRLDAVAVFEVDADAARKLAASREQAGMTAEPYGAHTIVRRSAGEGVPFHAVTANGRIVAALSLERVKQGLDVLDGKAPAMGSAVFSALADRNGGDGAIVVVAGSSFGNDMQGMFPQLSLLKQANSLCLTLGERDGQVKAALSVCAEAEAEAERMQNALLGLVEIGRAMAANEGKADFLRTVAVTRAGGTVRASGEWGTDEVLKAAGVAPRAVPDSGSIAPR